MRKVANSNIPIWNANIPGIPLRSTVWEYNFFLHLYLRYKGNEKPTITPFLLQSSSPVPVILVAPGGGYLGRAAHEGKPIAEWLNSIGIAAFVLQYRHAPFRHPIPFLDAQRAIRYIRHHAHEFNIDPKRVGMLGFSAGGHLTSTIGTLPDRGWFPPKYTPDDIDTESDLPTLQVLCYPVISFQTMPHMGSRYNLIGKRPDPKLIPYLSTEHQISPQTPPTFIWSTKTDQAVPFRHTTLFAEALQQHRVPFEMHIFEEGQHGLGLAENHPEVSKWPGLCAKWLKKQGF